MVQEVSFLFSCPRLLTLYFVMLCRSLHTHAYQKKNPNWLCRRQKVYVYETRACSKCEGKKNRKRKTIKQVAGTGWGDCDVWLLGVWCSINEVVEPDHSANMAYDMNVSE